MKEDAWYDNESNSFLSNEITGIAYNLVFKLGGDLEYIHYSTETLLI